MSNDSRTPKLDQIAAHGNRGDHRIGDRDSRIRCADGLLMSVIAGAGTYCTPRPDMCYPSRHGHMIIPEGSGIPCDYPGPYTHVEVMILAGDKPDSWAGRADAGDDSVYGWVPVELVRETILAHGGELA